MPPKNAADFTHLSTCIPWADLHQILSWDAVLGLLNMFYPVRYVTVTSRGPEFITPQIKAMLRRKNRLMRAGREEEAGALARQIGKIIK